MEKLILHVFPTDEGAFNLSPFCTKAEILLKMAGLPYHLSVPEDHKTFPKGKLPVLSDGDEMVEDSEFIRWHLQERYEASFTAALSERDRAMGQALCRMLENHTYLALVYARWVEEEGWARTRAIFFDGLDDETAEYIRGQMRACFDQSLMHTYTGEEIRALLDTDLHILAAALGDTPYFFGTSPSFIDAAAFSMLVNLYAAPEQTWARSLVSAHSNLAAYVMRGLAQWYPACRADAA